MRQGGINKVDPSFCYTLKLAVSEPGGMKLTGEELGY